MQLKTSDLKFMNLGFGGYLLGATVASFISRAVGIDQMHSLQFVIIATMHSRIFC